MRHFFIVNPTAGTGYSLEVEKCMARLMQKEFHQEFRFFHTEGVGHATKIAAELAHGREKGVVFSVGGDGTASEVAAGLAGTQVPMGIIPAGTGNDFIKSVGIPAQPEQALRFAMTHEAKAVDLGRVNDRIFLNVCGTGFDVTVLDYAEGLKRRFRGLTPYLLGLLKAIAHYRAVQLRVSIDGAEEEGKYLVCSAANGRYIGGGIPICPAADTGDGKLDAVLIQDVPGWRIPFYLPGLMMGRDLHFRIARHVLAEQITITGKNLRVNVDGEILSMDRADFRVLPRALQLICP